MVNQVADTRFFNHFFAAADRIVLLESFVFNEVYASHVGEIGVSTSKGDVHFTVHLPEAYPQGEAHFYPREFADYPHQNSATLAGHGGYLCLTTPFSNHMASRLALEINQLHGWLERYYVREEIDLHYEYVPIRRASGAHLLFDEESADCTTDRFATQHSGTFTYDALRSDKGATEHVPSAPVFLGTGLGNLPARWAATARTSRYTGVWTLLSQEPVLQRKARVESWEDLLPLLPADFYALLRELGLEHQFRRRSPTALNRCFLLAVGYRIPNGSGKEITWDVLLVPLELLRRDVSALKVQGRFDGLGRKKLGWGVSSNASYSRFFGRGQLPNSLANRRVLILGIGAVGSCLAESLVRGGLRNVAVADFDIVALGNICRSRFRFQDVDLRKTLALKAHLSTLSPYVAVEAYNSLTPSLPGVKNWKETVDWLNQYDLVVDCTANNQVLTTLWHAVTAEKLIHVSITDGAEQLIAVVGDNTYPLPQRREQLLAHLGRPVLAEFREGAGCWHPTFRASGANVESMVGLAVSELAEMARLKKRFRTFSLHHTAGRGIQVNTDQHYAQSGLGLYLIITQECLNEIEHLTLLHYPKEFGGVLVGNYSEDGSSAVVSRVITPKKYKNSPTSFAPDPQCINQQLRELPEQLQFLGDWHSHPDGPSQPSLTDRATIAKLATHPTVRTRSPLLLIAQTKRHQVVAHFFVHHHGHLHAYQPLPHEPV